MHEKKKLGLASANISEERKREIRAMGGKVSGPTKNRMAHLTPEERSQRMRELSLKAAIARKAKRDGK